MLWLGEVGKVVGIITYRLLVQKETYKKEHIHPFFMSKIQFVSILKND